MNVKREPLDLGEGFFKTEPNFASGHTLFGTPQKSKNEHEDVSDKIKQETIVCEGPENEQYPNLLTKIDDHESSEKNVQFCHTTVKKEFENTSVKVTDIRYIKEDSEYVESKVELLTSHCDLQTLKNENTEYTDCLIESNDKAQEKRIPVLSKNNTNDVLIRKRTRYICRKYFSTSNSSLNHLNKKYLVMLVACKICGKLFKKGRLQQHLIAHSHKKLFKCDICSKEFSHKHCLKRHLLIHIKEKPFKCNFCFKGYTKQSYLQNHLMTQINKKSLFKCNFCSKEFNYQCWLETHLLTHSNEKPFKCSICSTRFTLESNLQRHLVTHTY